MLCRPVPCHTVLLWLCSHCLPSCCLTQVTSLELAVGGATDHSLSQLPTQFPGLLRLVIDGSYLARCVLASIVHEVLSVCAWVVSGWVWHVYVCVTKRVVL